ncbi:FG-GAP repeat protein [Streptomyces sp. NPDC057908]|uniref:FG-GAP repeat protein n=1 Tax=Streptomyces sp. NPDC057908 TaxID=3346276 RepID=UPI0036E6B0A5
MAWRALAVDAAASTRAEFDGDGYTDVAVAAPGGTVNGKSGAGYFAVVYGMAEGPNGVERQVTAGAAQDRPADPQRPARVAGRSTSTANSDSATEVKPSLPPTKRGWPAPVNARPPDGRPSSSRPGPGWPLRATC